MVGSPFGAGLIPSGVAIDPAGKFAYVSSDRDVFAFRIKPNGALTEVKGSPFRAGPTVVGVAIDPTGRFAYVTNRTSSNVFAYKINAASGTLKKK